MSLKFNSLIILKNGEILNFTPRHQSRTHCRDPKNRPLDHHLLRSRPVAREQPFAESQHPVYILLNLTAVSRQCLLRTVMKITEEKYRRDLRDRVRMSHVYFYDLCRKQHRAHIVRLGPDKLEQERRRGSVFCRGVPTPTLPAARTNTWQFLGVRTKSDLQSVRIFLALRLRSIALQDPTPISDLQVISKEWHLSAVYESAAPPLSRVGEAFNAVPRYRIC